MVPGSNDEAIVYTQDGLLYCISLSGAFEPELFGDISGLMTGKLQGDETLASAVFHPGSSSHIYLNYTAGDEGAYYDSSLPTPPVSPELKRNVISRFEVVDGSIDVSSEEIIIEVLQPHQWHNVNEMVFDQGGNMYVGAGDGGDLYAQNDPDLGQCASNLLATIFRITPNPPGTPGYTVPGNPSFDDLEDCDDPMPEVYAIGLRNPWRMSFDNQGRLWAGDVGEHRWEEINQILPGKNYGWRVIEGPLDAVNSCYVGPPPCTPPPDYVDPRASYCQMWTSGCPYQGAEADRAVIGGYVYTGADLPELNGWYVYGDHASVRLRAFDADDDDSEPILLADMDVAPCTNCLRSFAQTPDGEILAVVATYGGGDAGVYRLGRAEQVPTPAPTLTPVPTPTPTPTPTPAPTPTP